MTEWGFNSEYQNNATFKKFRRKHPEELLQCFENLERFRTHLNETEPEPDPNFVTGIVRQEPKDLIAADERGCDKKGRLACRIYAYPRIKNRTIYILRIADKKDQNTDIQNSLKEIEKIKRTEP